MFSSNLLPIPIYIILNLCLWEHAITKQCKYSKNCGPHYSPEQKCIIQESR